MPGKKNLELQSLLPRETRKLDYGSYRNADIKLDILADVKKQNTNSFFQKTSELSALISILKLRIEEPVKAWKMACYGASAFSSLLSGGIIYFLFKVYSSSLEAREKNSMRIQDAFSGKCSTGFPEAYTAILNRDYGYAFYPDACVTEVEWENEFSLGREYTVSPACRSLFAISQECGELFYDFSFAAENLIYDGEIFILCALLVGNLLLLLKAVWSNPKNASIADLSKEEKAMLYSLASKYKVKFTQEEPLIDILKKFEAVYARKTQGPLSFLSGSIPRLNTQSTVAAFFKDPLYDKKVLDEVFFMADENDSFAGNREGLQRKW